MSKKQSIAEKLLHNASWLLGGKTLSGIFAALEVVILARMLGVNNYGLLVLIVAYVDILDNIFDFRVWETATKYIGTYLTEGEEEKVLSVIKLSYLINIISGLVALFITLITAKLAQKYFINSPEAYSFICIYAFSILFNTANYTSDAILRIFDKFKSIAFVSAFYNFFKLAAVVVILYFGMGIREILFSYVTASLIALVIRMILVSKTLSEHRLGSWWNSNLAPIKDKWKEISWFLGNTHIAGTLRMANDEYLGVLLLGYWSGKDAVAYYKVAKSFVKLMLRIEDPLYETIYPELVRFSKLNAFQDLKHLILFAIKKLMKVMIPVTVLVLIFASQIINVVFGAEYLEAVNALRVVTIAGLISLLIFWVNPVLLSFGRPGTRNILDIMTVISFILLLYLLVPKYSYMGAAIAFLGSVMMRVLGSIYILKTSVGRKNSI